METMTTTTTSTRRAAVLGAVALIGATLLGGCSTAPHEESGGTAADGPTTVAAKWGACMRDAGFPVDDPSEEALRSGVTSAPQGVDQERFAEAADTCAQQAGVERADGAAEDEHARQYEAVGSCIRDHGYPDFPELRHGVLRTGPDDYARATEDGFQQTLQECLHEFAPDTQHQQAG